MPLSDDLSEALQEPERETRCQIYKVGLSEKDIELIELYVGKIREDKALKQHERLFTTTSLAKILNNNRIKIGRTTLALHVNEGCSCVTRA